MANSVDLTTHDGKRQERSLVNDALPLIVDPEAHRPRGALAVSRP
jgi:hypothetical protein